MAQHHFLYAAAIAVLLVAPQATAHSVQPTGPEPEVESRQATDTSLASDPNAVSNPTRVGVQPRALDSEIAERLQRILEATGWIRNPSVEVDEGVVFLTGTADSEEHREWAGNLARNTEDVVAVVNAMEASTPIWDLRPAVEGLEDLGRDFVKWFPFVVVAIAIFALASAFSWLTTRLSRIAMQTRIQSHLLREVTARVLGALVLVLGLYLVLRVCGLSRLALTVIGGTGLVGLVIGIAFRDITENFLASIFLSIQRPFRVGDLVEIVDTLGYVQWLTVRTTVLMTLDGNHVQIPNAAVYKNTIRNYSTNPNRREDFVVGIGYDVPISLAQEVALVAIQSHPAVLKEPEPWVLADGLGPATVNLRVYFWLNGKEHSWLKVRSSVIRLVKRSFQERGIEMPDEAREIVFPHGVPVRLTRGRPGETLGPRDQESCPVPSGVAAIRAAEPVSTEAEAGLKTEAYDIDDQARQSPQPESGENLLSSG
jgi:small conductance mechanosensitive channel